MAPKWNAVALGLACVLGTTPSVRAAPPAAPAPAAATTDLDAARLRLEAERRKVVEANLALSPAESSAFAPVYEKFRATMHELDARYLGVVDRYVDAVRSGSLTDAQATSLLDELLATGVERADARKTWRARFSEVLPPRKVVALYQLENRLDAVVTLGVASQIPLAQ